MASIQASSTSLVQGFIDSENQWRSEAPIGLLPVEFLTYVFSQTLPLQTDRSESSHPLNSKAPLLLTEVCREWRELALSTPDLWQVVAFKHRSEEQHVALCVGVEEWFSRSTARGISLSATFTSEGFERSCLASHVPWSRMTCLELKDDLLSPFTLINVLKDCPGLITCKLAGIGYQDYLMDDLLDSGKTVHLSHLTTLTIDFVHVRVETDTDIIVYYTKISTFLSLLVLPSLEVLELCAPSAGSEDYGLPDTLLDLGSPRLMRLNLDGILFRHEDLDDFLESVPTLTHLCLATSPNLDHQNADLAKNLALRTLSHQQRSPGIGGPPSSRKTSTSLPQVSPSLPGALGCAILFPRLARLT